MPKSLIKRVAGLLGLVVLSGPLSAAETDDTWSLEFVPYLWAASIQGTTAAGDAESPIDPGYTLFAMENLQMAFMGVLRLSRGHWSWQLDTLHVDYQDDFAGRFIDTHIGIRGGFLEIASGYKPDLNGNLEWLAGLRNVSFTTEIGLDPGPEGRAKKTWLDPFVGIGYRLGNTDDEWPGRLGILLQQESAGPAGISLPGTGFQGQRFSSGPERIGFCTGPVLAVLNPDAT
jgi:hypothetical protein